MKLHKFAAARKKWNSSPFATLLFLLASLAIFYGCILFIGHVAENSLKNTDMRQSQYEQRVTPAPSAIPTQDARIVAAIRTPAPTFVPTVTPTVSVSPYPSPSAEQTAQPTPTQPTAPSAAVVLPSITKNTADISLIITDESGAPEWITFIRIHSETCRILFVPRNTIVSGMKQPLSECTAEECKEALERVWPLRYARTVIVRKQGLPAFIDRFGGVTINGSSLGGADTVAYLENGPADELLRIGRQQDFARAYIEKLRSVGLLSLASSRFEFDPYIMSDIKAGELIFLFDMLRSLDAKELIFYTLPVDSLQQDGIRYYKPDISMAAKLAESWVRETE